MTEFLTGNEVSRSLSGIVAGRNLRCAVSAWSRGAAVGLRKTGIDVQKTRIICNPTNGGCTPEALLELGAPHNPQLRQHSGLSTNIWMSDHGAMVGSALPLDINSEMAGTEIKHIEAATYHKAQSSTWKSAIWWFDKLYEGAQALDIEAIEIARYKCSLKKRLSEWKLPEQGSLLDFVSLNPELFIGIGFVITSKMTTERERSQARQNAIASAKQELQIVDTLPAEGIIIGFDKSDLIRCPNIFVEFRVPNNSLITSLRTVYAVDVDNGTLFTRRNSRYIDRILPNNCPNLQESQRKDGPRIRLLRDAGACLFSTAVELAQAINAL